MNTIFFVIWTSCNFVINHMECEQKIQDFRTLKEAMEFSVPTDYKKHVCNVRIIEGKEYSAEKKEVDMEKVFKDIEVKVNPCAK